MRYIVAILIFSVLTGCPAVTRLYVHNKSEATLIYNSYWEDVKPTKIGPGRTKWVPVNSGETSCVEFEINDQVHAYQVSPEAKMAGKGTGYGSRIDSYYEYGRMFVRKYDGNWMEVASRESCDDA